MGDGLPSDGRSRQLFDEGGAILERLWDDAAAMVRDHEHEPFHSPRNTLSFCRVVLARGEAVRAEQALVAVLGLQETHPGDGHYGNFRWYLEDRSVTDLNAVEFVLDDLIAIVREHRDALSPAIVRAAERAIALGLEEIARLDVHPSYTNIALSDIANSTLGGELIDADRFVRRGGERLDAWLALTSVSGMPHEFNSPTYLAVDILRMASLVEATVDPDMASKARAAEALLWRHVATHYHPGLAQLAGPHSRSYFDGWSGAPGFLKLLLWRLLGDDRLRRASPYAPRGREEGHVAVALATLHCPDDALGSLRAKKFPFLVRERIAAPRPIEVTTYMTADCALGSASRTYDVGEPPERWPGFNALHAFIARDEPPGFSALYTRYVIDERAPSAESPDHWDEGQHVAAQEGNRAIIAYGLVPRLRPMTSCKLSVRLLGLRGDDDVWINDTRLADSPRTLAPLDRVTVAVGSAYVALVPLAPTDLGHDAPIVLTREGDVLTLDLYNYRGPPRSPWEYRSLAGPFYRANVRNAVALEIAQKTQFESFGEFCRHIARATIDDDVNAGLMRQISYASTGGSVALRYDLRNMQVMMSEPAR